MTEETRIERAQAQVALAPLSSTELLTRVAQIHDIMEHVLIESTYGEKGVSRDYGRIPGCGEKPALLQPGAEKLAMAFRLATQHLVEDISTPDCRRYRVRCIVNDQLTGIIIGDECGECSSDEEKYAWRKAVAKEYEETPVERRRVKHYKNYDQQQVRTNPADVANTILAMACKRAKVRAVRAALAASDIFDVNTEDIPVEIREAIIEGEAAVTSSAVNNAGRPHAATTTAPPRQSAPASTPPPPPASDEPMISKVMIRTIMQLMEATPGMMEFDDAAGKNKFTADAFKLLGECGAKGKWDTFTESTGKRILAALNARMDQAQATATAGADDITDPFADQ